MAFIRDKLINLMKQHDDVEDDAKEQKRKPSLMYQAASKGNISVVEELINDGNRDRPLFLFARYAQEKIYDECRIDLFDIKESLNNISKIITSPSFISFEIARQCAIIELFFKHHTDELNNEVEKKPGFELLFFSFKEFDLLPFFIWSAYYNLTYLFQDECFHKLIINHKKSFQAAIEVATALNSKEFITYAAKKIGVNILFTPLLITVAHHNQDLLVHIIYLIESFGLTLKKVLDNIKFESSLCVNSLTTEDNILLFYSIRLENNAALSYLLQKGLSPNGYCDARYEDTLLHLAVRMKNIRTQELLLKHGANPNHGDFAKRTPLHEACESEQWELTILMVEEYHGNMRQMLFFIFFSK